MNRRRAFLLLCITVVAGWAVAQDKQRKTSIGGLTYFLDTNYTRLGSEAGGFMTPGAQVIYSMDGAPLDLVTMIAGARDGNPLDRLRDQKLDGTSTPFKATLSPDEIGALYQEMLVRNQAITSYERLPATPLTFGGVTGFKYEFSFKRYGLPIKGVSYGAVVKRRLYLMTYTAPSMYVFDKHLPTVEEMARTAAIEL